MSGLDFKTSLKRSSRQFKDVFQYDILNVLKGRFEIVEGITMEAMAKTLDTLGGIDAWHIHEQNGIRGVALRVQTGPTNWHTFTIRNKRDSGAKTEYEKRKYAIEHHYLYPYLTIQAYFNQVDETPLAYAIARTQDIIEFIDRGLAIKRHTGKDQIGQAEFYVVDWYKMRQAGYKIVIKDYSVN